MCSTTLNTDVMCASLLLGIDTPTQIIVPITNHNDNQMAI